MLHVVPVQFQAPLGAVDVDVKELQQALVKLYELSGRDSRFAGVKATGELTRGSVTSAGNGWWTTRALMNIVRGQIADIPVIKQLIGTAETLVGFIPGVSLENALFGIYAATDAGNEINDFIRSRASAMRSGVELAWLFYSQAPDAPPTPAPGFVQVKVADISKLLPAAIAAQTAKYPPGTFVVRDPAANRYRILVPLR